MAKKEFSYYGKSLEELQKMSLEEFAKLVSTRKRRSLERGFTDAQKKFMKSLEKNGDNIKTHVRDLVVLPQFVGKTFHLHRGNKYERITIVPEMIGHYFGELTYTRARVAHSAPGVGATRSSSAISVK